MQDFWNERYGASEYIYGTQPNVFFKSCLEQLVPGALLLPAEGEGRNAVYAAGRGWEVHAFDFSTAGRDKALALARQQGVDIHYVLSDFLAFNYPEGAFTAAALIFAHMPEVLRKTVHKKIISSLQPGGHLILEAFTPAQLDFRSGGPRTLDLLYTPEQLLEDFGALNILEIQETEVWLDEGDHHQGKAAVVRLFAKK